MKKSIFNIALAAVVSLTATSCYDDKGNYDYHDLDVVTISTEGLDIPDNYGIDRGDRLTIAPDVYFNGKKNDADAPLDYLWTIYTTATGVGVDYTVDTLGRERTLDAVVNRVGGTYRVNLTVTNRLDKTETYYHVGCDVYDNIPAGWMLLYEPADKPGYSDIGLVCNEFSTAKYASDKSFWGLYGASNGGAAEGTPVNIMHIVQPMATHGAPIFATSKDIYTASQSTFEKVLDTNDFFLFGKPENMDLRFMTLAGVGQTKIIVINGNNVYESGVNQMSGAPGGFSVPKQGEVGQLAAWSSSATVGVEEVVYDQDNSCFYNVPTGNAYFYTYVQQDPALTEFDVNNCNGMRLEYGDWGANFMDIILFSKGNERYVGVANFNRTNGSSNAVGTGLKNVTSSPDIQNATSFAANYMGEYCFYSAGNKVYNLAYNSGKDATVAWTAPSADEVVTCVRTHKYYFQSILMAIMPNANQILHIATWNEAKKEGKLYEMRINPTSGVIMPGTPTYEYTVPGKVKDMTWKFQMVR